MDATAPSHSLPATDWPIAGHAVAVRGLQRALAMRRVGHAYLITGPDGVGKRTLARLFAATLVCTGASAERPVVTPCGVCRACLHVARGVHPDVETLSLVSQQAAAEAKGTRNRALTIESIRSLRERLVLRPLEAAWRVAIVEDAETMSGGMGLPAASALLKTLEEPPPFAVLILIAPEADSVLPTLRSRCQQIPLGLVAATEIERFLREHQGVDAATASTLAAAAGGRPGWALAAAAEPGLLTERHATLSRGLQLIQASSLERLQRAEEMANHFAKADWRAAQAELDVLLGLWRDVLLVHTGCRPTTLLADGQPDLERLANRLTLAQVHAALAATRTGGLHLHQNVSPRLALEAMVLAWPSVAEG